jgi:SHS family lactate transporter-like MFS transporter
MAGGPLAHRFARRPILADIVRYSLMELASAFAPVLTILIMPPALCGITMGEESARVPLLSYAGSPLVGRATRPLVQGSRRAAGKWLAPISP